MSIFRQKTILKRVPDKIKEVTPTSASVIPDHRQSNKIQTGLCAIYWKNISLAGKS